MPTTTHPSTSTPAHTNAATSRTRHAVAYVLALYSRLNSARANHEPATVASARAAIAAACLSPRDWGRFRDATPAVSATCIKCNIPLADCHCPLKSPHAARLLARPAPGCGHAGDSSRVCSDCAWLP